MKKLVAAALFGFMTLSSMAEHTVISTPHAPSAIGPYSQAIASHGLVFLSGQISIDPKTNTIQLFDNDIRKQTALVLSNIDAVLTAAHCTKQDVMKATVLLTNMKDFDAMNAVYSEFFGNHKPARSTYAVAALPKNANIEIEVVASCAGAGK